MKKLVSKEEKSNYTTNNLIIPESDMYKFTAIAFKLHQSIQLTQCEKKYWHSFTKEEKAYTIMGVTTNIGFP